MCSVIVTLFVTYILSNVSRIYFVISYIAQQHNVITVSKNVVITMFDAMSASLSVFMLYCLEVTYILSNTYRICIVKIKKGKRKKLGENGHRRGPVGVNKIVLCNWLGARGVGGTQYPYIYNTKM